MNTIRESFGLGRGVLALVALTLCGSNAHGQEGDRAIQEVLDRPVAIRTADLKEIRESRILRVLTTYNKTNFFVETGRPRGFEYELIKEYEKSLNEGMPRGQRVTAVFVPVPKLELLSALIEGKGDIVAAGLTVTPERAAQIAFTAPYLSKVSEILVTRKGAEISSLEQLGGRKVYVAAGTSYVDHLRKLNQELQRSGNTPAEIVEVPSALETEDLLELVNAGIIDHTFADRHLAEVWSRVLADIVLRPDLTIHEGGQIAWAVRAQNPDLLANLNAFVKTTRRGTLLGNILFRRYYQSAKWVGNPLTKEGRARLDRFITLFKKYGDRYDLDWLALAAVAYQESGFDPSVKSAAGAVGLMQITAQTAVQVGISDFEEVENNIHAGAKYLAWLRDTFFLDPEIERAARVDFIVAAYNAGPSRVVGLRKRAAEMGLDPRKWFGNVEQVALRDVGREPVQYVANVNKYYFAFSLSRQALLDRARELEALKAQDQSSGF